MDDQPPAPKEKVDPVRLWRLHELQRLGFTRAQRAVLLKMMDDGDVQLSDIRSWVEDRGWTPMQAFLNVA